jgi:ferredoxin
LSAADITLCADQELTGRDQLEEVRSRYDAVLLTGGTEMAEKLEALGVTPIPDGYATNWPGIFLGGSCRKRIRLAAVALRDGRAAAAEVHTYVTGQTTDGVDWFDAHAGTLPDGKLAELATCSSKPEKLTSPPTPPETCDEAVAEAGRCMACDCRDKAGCRLRQYATDYAVGHIQARPPLTEDVPLLIRQHPDIIHEPGKCIRCGLCVRLAEKLDEPIGLAITGRGRQTRLQVPFGASWQEALTHSADQCIEICPTGALTRRH